MSPRERLDAAIAHFEAGADGDVRRMGLAFAELLHARNELLEEERFATFAPNPASFEDGALSRTRERIARSFLAKVPNRQDSDATLSERPAGDTPSAVRFRPAGNY